MCTMWGERNVNMRRGAGGEEKVLTVFRSNFWRGRECKDDCWVQSKGQLVINLCGEEKIVQFVEYISRLKNKLLW